ncbi:MAG: hypothetical protein K8T10_11205 [Candidatus Eremiobacteraeota bacterium]|nr:hypothetical protein [Candidatus Eremiobacteraeota bacterium]
MNTKRIFNWESSHIGRGLVQQPKKKKGWFQKIKDTFTPGRRHDSDMREDVAKIFRNYKASVTGEREKLGYQTAALVAKKADGIEDKDYRGFGLLIVNGALLGRTIVGKAISGPIGLAIPGFINEPILDQIQIEDTPTRLAVAANTILLMDGAEDMNLHSEFPKAASAFIKEVASYKDDPLRASAAEKIGEILDTSGISDDDKRSISRDSILVLKGDVDPLWVLNKSEEYAKKGSEPAKKFSDYLNNNLSVVLDPINDSLEKASSGKTGSDKVKAVLSESRKIIEERGHEMSPLVAVASLRKLKSEPGTVSSNVKKILNLINKADDKKIASAYANMALDLKSPDLSLKFNDLVLAGKNISRINSEGSNITMGKWFGSYINKLKSAAEDPGEKKIVQLTKNILSKIDPELRNNLAGAFFNILTADKIPLGPAFTAKLGSETVKNMPEENSSDRQKLIKAAKVFIDKLSTQSGETDKLMTQVSSLLDEAEDTVGVRIAKASLSEASKSITSASCVLARIGCSAINPMPEKYYGERKEKINRQRAILEKTRELTSDNDTIKFIDGAIATLDGVENDGDAGCRIGQDALGALASGQPIDPVVELAKLFCEAIKPMPQKSYTERSEKTDSTIAMIETLRDTATDPGTKKRIDRALDITKTIKDIFESDDRGYEVGLDSIRQISKRKTEDPGMEIGRIGYNFTKDMSTEHYEERDKQQLLCRSFYSLIEKHTEKPELKKAAESFRKLLEDLKECASSYIGVNGLEMIGEGRKPNLAKLANMNLKMLNSMSEDNSWNHKDKDKAANVILKHLGKNAEDDYQKKAVSTIEKIVKGMGGHAYEYKLVEPLLNILEKKPRCSLTTTFCNMGLEFIDNDSLIYADQRNKTTAAEVFISQIPQLPKNSIQKAIAQSISMYCRETDQENGYIVAKEAFKIISEFENNSGGFTDIQDLISQLAQHCPEDSREQLIQNLKTTIPSFYFIKEKLQNAGGAGKEIKQEEEYVVIGGVRLKKSRS